MGGSDLPDDYRPSEDEPFMNERQLAYFRKKLLDWKAEILRSSRETLDYLQEVQSSSRSDRSCQFRDRACA